MRASMFAALLLAIAIVSIAGLSRLNNTPAPVTGRALYDPYPGPTDTPEPTTVPYASNTASEVAEILLDDWKTQGWATSDVTIAHAVDISASQASGSVIGLDPEDIMDDYMPDVAMVLSGTALTPLFIPGDSITSQPYAVVVADRTDAMAYYVQLYYTLADALSVFGSGSGSP